MKHRPRKRFGQHFLTDQSILEKMVAYIAPQPHDHIIEIGPGKGALTQHLLTHAPQQLDLIEIDRDLVSYLTNTLHQYANINIHNQDALTFDFTRLTTARHLRIVGNLPYNISTPLLFYLAGQHQVIRNMYFLLQKEVVDRIVSAPNCSAYGRLSVMMQYHYQVEKLFPVKPGAFHPPPKVNSAFLKMTPHAIPPVQVDDYAMFKAVVTQCFSQRRKTIRNALKKIIPQDQMVTLNIDPTTRGETLAITDFAALANAAVLLQADKEA